MIFLNYFVPIFKLSHRTNILNTWSRFFYSILDTPKKTLISHISEMWRPEKKERIFSQNLIYDFSWILLCGNYFLI